MTRLVPIDTAARAYNGAPPSQGEAAAGFRAVTKMFDLWGLKDAEAADLLDLSLTTYRRWKRNGPSEISRDQAFRISNLLGIHKGLAYFFTDPSRRYEWVRKSNRAFSGRSALDVMRSNDVTGLMRVRRWLDCERGAW